MTDQQPARFRLGRTIALAGVVVAISLAILTMTLLALNLLPQIFPTLYPASSAAMLTGATMVTTGATQSNPIRMAIDTARNAWMNGEADQFANLFTEDGEFIVPGHVYRGRDEIRTVTAEFAESHSNVQINIHRIITEGNQAVVEWHWEDTEIASGKRTVADDAIVIDFEVEQIKRWREYIDTTVG
jgi:uncharacterized protein (TIGR02246 family)